MQTNFAQWRQYKTDKGQIYLSNPLTGEVKWLWTRHHDRRTGRDYLVNIVSEERVWATRANAHLCPRPPGVRPQSAPAAVPAAAAVVAAAPVPSASAAPMLVPSAAAAPGRAPAARFREVARQGARLGPDEVVLEEVATGKRFVSNKRTGESRWLSAPPSAGAPPTPHAAGRPGALPPAAGATAQAQRLPSRPMPGNGRRLGNGTAGRPAAAALVVQRAYRAFKVRRVGVLDKLAALDRAVTEIDTLAATGTRFDLTELRRVANDRAATAEQRKSASERLLQLGEVVTQAMLKVDGVESAGLMVIRNKRKRCVTKLLELTDSIEKMRGKLRR